MAAHFSASVSKRHKHTEASRWNSIALNTVV